MAHSRYLAQGERIVTRTRRHVLVMTKPFFVAVGAIFGAILLGALLSPNEGADIFDTILSLVDQSKDAGQLLRGGVASGEGLPRAGDWYGRPVNLASRITSFARRGTVVTSSEVREAAGAVGPALAAA